MSLKAGASSPIRIGVLGTSRAAVAAVIRPARALSGVAVVAVGGRDPERTRRYAERFKIPTVFPDYASVIDHDSVDVIYNPLPNSLHGRWTLAALAAGKHVLCEKPLAANAQEARQVRDAAVRSGCMLMEGFHYRFHPLAQRIQDLLAGGTLGKPEHLVAKFCIFWFNRQDIRFHYELGGGAVMDIGCYPIHLARSIIGEQPQVQSAEVELIDARVDASAIAKLVFPSGATADIECSLRAPPWRWRSVLSIKCEEGSLYAINPFIPHVFSRLSITTPKGKFRQTLVKSNRSTYSYQLEALVQAIREGTPVLTGADDAIGNMQVIDDVYAAAGLPIRQPSPGCC